MSKKAGKISYDTLTLIELVEQRPCIWDKTLDIYKDRVKKAIAWMEVYQFLVKDFENLSQEEKMETGKSVNEKWKHIRDAFALSLRKTNCDKRVKKYIYFDQLQFLLKILEKDDTESNISHTTEREQSNDELIINGSLQCENHPPAPGPSSRKRSKIPVIDEEETEVLEASETTYQQTPLKMDEDAAFFESVTPAVQNFTEDEKLDFRMGVLSLIKQIKRKRYETQLRRLSNNSRYSFSYSTATSAHRSEDYYLKRLQYDAL